MIPISVSKQTIRGPMGYFVKLDAGEIFPDDPGNGTPAMVYAPFGKGSATFYCALDTGECGDAELPDDVHGWLEAIAAAVDHWFAYNVPKVTAEAASAAAATVAS